MYDDIFGNFFGKSQTLRKTEGFSKWDLNSYIRQIESKVTITVYKQIQDCYNYWGEGT
jgi:hypothetical protein